MAVLSVGAAQAATLYHLPRRTLYDAVARVEKDEALFRAALERRRAIAEKLDAALAALQASATLALQARITAGKLTSKLLLQIAQGPGGGAGGSGGGGGGKRSTLVVPHVLATPRLDTSESSPEPPPEDTADGVV
mgnify:CR=1 FL=1